MAFAASDRATWTIRGLAGGYARDANSSVPIDNAYAVLIEPLESFAAQLAIVGDSIANPPNYAYTKDGRRYVSALAGQR